MSLPRFIFHRFFSYSVIALAVILFAVFAWSSSESRKNASNRVVDWLPAGSAELKTFLKNYYRIFPEGELLMISWKGCNAKDNALDKVLQRLSAPADGYDTPYFKRVLSTQSVLETLTSPPLNLPSSAAQSRLQYWLLGRNGKDACAVAMISPTGSQHRGAAIEYVFKSVEAVTGLQRSDIFVAGPTIDSAAIDEISAKSQQFLLPFFLTLSFAMLLICLRHFLLAFLIFITAVVNEQLCGTLLYWTNAHVDSISMLISSLVYVLTISAGIHLVNYYRKAISEGTIETAPVRMIQTGFLPCFLALATTILGFVSLMASKMIPIRTFGIYASLALFLGTAWLFIFLFALLNRFPAQQWNVTQTKRNRREIRFWKRWMNIVLRFHLPIVFVSLTAMTVFYFGVEHLKTTVSFHSMFPKSAKIITDYETLENRFTGLIPVEVVLRIPEAGNESQTVMDQLYFVRELRNELSQSAGVEDTVSILSFLPNLPAQANYGANATARRRAMNLMFKQHSEVFKETGFFSQEPDKKKPPAYYWRLSLRTHSKYSGGYDNLLAIIRERIDVVKTAESAAAFQNLQFTITGGVPLAHRAQAQLLSDLTNSVVSAFALIFLTMVVMLRGVVRGLLAMVPNIFPCVLVFGAMGFLGIPVDMGSMMTASVAMGIAVDGTLHFLTHFNHGLKQGMPRHVAVHFAYQNCATALFQSTVICCLGMLVFGFSGFMPVSRFAFLLNTLLFASFIGDAVVFPAILFSPLGRFFEQKRAAGTG